MILFAIFKVNSTRKYALRKMFFITGKKKYRKPNRRAFMDYYYHADIYSDFLIRQFEFSNEIAMSN